MVSSFVKHAQCFFCFTLHYHTRGSLCILLTMVSLHVCYNINATVNFLAYSHI